MPSPKKQSAAEQVEQLNMMARAYIARPEFTPGDLVMRRPETMPAEYRNRDVSQLAVVMEVVPSLREMTEDEDDYPGQGIFIACTNPLGEHRTAWVPSWQYQRPPPDMVAGFIGQTTH